MVVVGGRDLLEIKARPSLAFGWAMQLSNKKNKEFISLPFEHIASVVSVLLGGGDHAGV